MTSPEITDAAVEAACRAYWPAHWPRMFDKADQDSIRGHMRAALTAALPHLAAGRAEAVAAGRQTMDTAPKDGTPILVWWPIVAINDDGELTDQEVGGERLVTEWNGGGWLEPDCLNGLNSIAFDDDREYAECPTLWRRLPELSLQVAVPVPADDDGKQQDGFSSGDFRHTADLLRSGDESIVKATASNNLNIILAALDRASIRSALVSAPALVAEPGEAELPACPFCGGTNLKSGGDDKIVGTWCLTCEASGPNEYGKFSWYHRAPSPSQEALREAASIISDLFASVRMGDPSRTFDYEWERRGLSWLAAQWARDPGTLINMWTADKVRSHHAALAQSAPVKAGG